MFLKSQVFSLTPRKLFVTKVILFFIRKAWAWSPHWSFDSVLWHTQYCVSGSTIKLCNELWSVAQGWVTVKVTEQVVSTSRTFGNSALPIIHALGWGISPHTEQLWTLYTQLQFTLIGDSQRSLDGGISRDISDRYSLSLRRRQKVYCSKCLLFCKRHQVSKPLQDPVHCRILNFCRERV